jgi:hypothetical protein
LDLFYKRYSQKSLRGHYIIEKAKRKKRLSALTTFIMATFANAMRLFEFSARRTLDQSYLR